MKTRMTATNRILLGLSVAAMTLTSCVKDDLYDTSHPTLGAIEVITTWEAIDPASLPSGYLLSLDDIEQEVTGDRNIFKTLVRPGEYEILAHHRPEGFDCSGNIVSVKEHDGYIISAPDHFFSGKSRVTVACDDTTGVTVPMRRHTRDLHIELAVSGGDPSCIESVGCTLQGIAHRFSHSSQMIENHKAETHFPLYRNGAKLTADLRLLGIVGDNQRLNLEIRFSDRPKTQVIEVDISKAMAPFNDKMTTGYEIKGTLSIATGMAVIATITGWNDIEGDSSIAS